MIKNSKNKLLHQKNSDLVLKIYAICLSIIIWFIMSITLYPTITTTIKNVPLVLNLTGSIAEDYSLKPVDFENQTVDVRITGMRYEIGNYTADDLEARVIIEDVKTAGKKTLKIDVIDKHNNCEILSYDPGTIDITFDRYVTKSFIIKADAPGYKAADGYIMDPATCVPKTIDITGPEQQVDKITDVVVRTNGSGETLNEAQTTNDTTLYIYSSDTLLDKTDFEFDTNNYSIELPVYKIKTLPFEVVFQNTPKNFDTSSLKFNLSETTIDVGGSDKALDNIESVPLTYIDFNDLDLNSQFDLAFSLPSSVRNISEIHNVLVSLDSTGLSTKVVSVKQDQIHMLYEPANYNVSIQAKTIHDIKVNGPKEIIDIITPEDLVAEMDLSSTAIDESTYTIPVTIYAPDYPQVWISGSYKVAVKFTNKN